MKSKLLFLHVMGLAYLFVGGKTTEHIEQFNTNVKYKTRFRSTNTFEKELTSIL